MLKCHNPGRARQLGKILGEAAKMGFSQLLTADSHFHPSFSPYPGLLYLFPASPIADLPRKERKGAASPCFRGTGPWGPGAETEYTAHGFQAPDWPGPDLCDTAINLWKCHKVTPGTSAVSETKIWT